MAKIINIYDPVVWEIYENIKILDIPKERIELVKKFVKENMFKTHILYYNEKNITDEDSVNDILNLVSKFCLDRTSLIAIDERTDEIVGIILLKVMDESFHNWTTIRNDSKSEILKSMINVTYDMLNGYNENREDKCLVTLHAFLVCSLPEYCGYKLKTKLLLAAERVAASMGVRYITHVGFSLNNQRRSLRAGMVEGYRFYYALYKDVEGNRPFQIKVKREWFCILYIKVVKPQISYTNL